jgi:hypothetical protein
MDAVGETSRGQIAETRMAQDIYTAAYVTDASLQSNPDQDPEYDAVFGKYEEGQVNYKSVGW